MRILQGSADQIHGTLNVGIHQGMEITVDFPTFRSPTVEGRRRMRKNKKEAGKPVKETTLMASLESTLWAAADLGGWDRRCLNSDGRTPATSTVEQREHRGPERESNMSWQTLAKQAGLGKVDFGGIEKRRHRKPLHHEGDRDDHER